MRRTTIYLDPDTEILLKLEAMRSRRPMAEIIRQAVAAYVKSAPRRPPGAGAFRSGKNQIAEKSEEHLRRSAFGKKK